MRPKLFSLFLIFCSFTSIFASADTIRFFNYYSQDSTQMEYYKKLGYNYVGIYVDAASDPSLMSHAQPARYVRITATGLPSGYWASISEFRIFGLVNTSTGIATQDLTSGKKDTASSQQPGNLASAAIDNNLTTRWCAANQYTGAWLKIDLGSTYNLLSTQTTWEKKGIYRYKIETSIDNTTWTTVVDQQNNNTSARTFSDVFTTGQWIYNNNNYASGGTATTFLHQKSLAENTYHLKVIPLITSFSHVDGIIKLDNGLPEAQRSVSDFNVKYPKPAYTDASKINQVLVKDWADSSWGPGFIKDYDTSDCVAAAGELGYNKGADEFFRETLNIIKKAYASTPPVYIHIGHDEQGKNSIRCVKLGRTFGRPETPSQLVAMEINARVQQINSTFGTTPKVMIWGDCFVPGDNGETYGTCGDVNTGHGGVLQLLDSTYGLKSRLIIMPWQSLFIDGTNQYPSRVSPIDGKGLIFSKTKELSFLDKLGYQYIPCPGEHGPNMNTDWAPYERQTTFEWVRASQLYPKHLAGFGHCTWDFFNKSVTDGRDGTTVYYTGWSAPLLAYWAWTYPNKSLQMPRYNSYSSRMWKNVKYLKSRQDMAKGVTNYWLEGTHYFKPPLTGPLHTVPEITNQNTPQF